MAILSIDQCLFYSNDDLIYANVYLIGRDNSSGRVTEGFPGSGSPKSIIYCNVVLDTFGRLRQELITHTITPFLMFLLGFLILIYIIVF